jgi:hypothetical protein
VRVPKWTLSGAVQYEIPVGQEQFVVPRIDASYRSDIAFSNDILAVSSVQEGYALVNARLTWRNDALGLSIAGAVTNVFDKYYLFIGLTLGSLDQGWRSWGAPFFERTYGWGPATYGQAVGVVSIVAMLAGLWLGSRRVGRLQAKGMVDGSFRVILYMRAVSIPFAIAERMMPTPELALACGAVGFLSLGMTGPLLNAVMLIVTPNQIRGQVMALYLFIFTVIGQGLSPVIIGATTDYIFTSPDDLRWSIMSLHIIFLPAALAVTWLG